ncbi:MAG: RagB/SusD family nutrient uptake outer membrane protein, partial [Bacteroidales bacterium]
MKIFNKHKIKNISVLLLGWFLLGGCSESFLDMPPLGQQSEEAFNPEDAVVACYNALNPYNLQWQIWYHYHLGEMITDNCYKGGQSSSDAPGILMLAQNSTLPDNNNVLTYWRVCYQQIYRQNWTLQGLNSITTISDDERNKMVAEVKFLRAYSYFMLVRAFENVPLITEPLSVSDIKMDKSPATAIWARIEKDLNEAIPYLKRQSEINLSSDFGRATKGAAQALLAKAYLYQKKYAECETVAGDVISSGDYTLTPDYKDVWSGESEHGDSGTIFDIVYTSSDIGRHISYWAISQRSRNWRGWGMCCPSADLLNEFKQEPGDPRIIWTFQFNNDISEGRTVSNEGYDNPDLMHSRKAWNALSKDPTNGNYGKNYKVLRYADVLLMYAEAANENGHTADAL